MNYKVGFIADNEIKVSDVFVGDDLDVFNELLNNEENKFVMIKATDGTIYTISTSWVQAIMAQPIEEDEGAVDED